jgi:hypothetical protein
LRTLNASLVSELVGRATRALVQAGEARVGHHEGRQEEVEVDDRDKLALRLAALRLVRVLAERTPDFVFAQYKVLVFFF